MKTGTRNFIIIIASFSILISLICIILFQDVLKNRFNISTGSVVKFSETSKNFVNEYVDKYDPRKIKKYYRELKEKVSNEEEVILDSIDVVKSDKPLRYSVKINEKSDLKIYAHIAGPIGGVKVYKPSFKECLSCDYIFNDTPLDIKNAEAGEWTIEMVPYKIESGAEPGIPFAMIITSIPPEITLDLPKAVNTKQLDIKCDIGTNDIVEIYVNDNKIDKKVIGRKLDVELDLVEGDNKIKINRIRGSYKSKQSEYNVIVDTVSPEINVNNSTENQIVTSDDIFILHGLVSDDVIDLRVNNEPVRMGEFERGFRKDFKFEKGTHVIELKATDSAGNVTKKTIEVVKL